MLLATHEHSKLLQRSAALQAQAASRAAGMPTPSISPVLEASTPSIEALSLSGGVLWLDKLHRVTSVPGAWHSLANALERRAYHRSQLVSWAQRFSEMRHARAISNLASLVRRSAAAASALGLLQPRSGDDPAPAPE